LLARNKRVQRRHDVAMVATRSHRTLMKRSYDPVLTTDPHAPLYRVDKAVLAAQKTLDAALDAKRHHTSHSLAQEVIKEAWEGLRRAEHARTLKVKELAQRSAELREARR
jgi:hypothetical protein